MARPIITLTTDFGTADSYVAQMKGTILAINPDACLVDVTHSIPPQNVDRASMILREAVECFPPDTIHLVVVDPGVGSSRALLAVEIGGWRFVAPDNGVLTNVLRRFSHNRVVQIQNHRFWRTDVSTTFHGRDILAPVAAHWSLGVDLTEFGPLHREPLVQLLERQGEQHGEELRGEVLWSDHFGNLITSVRGEQIPQDNRETMTVTCGEQRIVGIHEHYAQVERERLLALIGSSGWLEIAVREGSAKAALNCGIGEMVSVRVCPAAVRDQRTSGTRSTES